MSIDAIGKKQVEVVGLLQSKEKWIIVVRPRCSEVSASDIRPSGLCCLRPPNLELSSAQDQTIS